jgi:hypothetical protein
MSKRKTKGLLIEVMNLISTFMMPCKDPKFLYFHVKKSRLIHSNPIQVGVNIISISVGFSLLKFRWETVLKVQLLVCSLQAQQEVALLRLPLQN